MDAIERSNWDAVIAAFISFFDGLGTVDVDGRHVSFSAGEAGTGLALDQAGTSQSFMHLHEMGGRWERVAFNTNDHEVVLEGEGFSYTYRVPPVLLHG